MIKTREALDYIFTLVKNTKKDIVKIYPNGIIVGTDEQFTSLNVLSSNDVVCKINEFGIDIPYVFYTKEMVAFMRDINTNTHFLSTPFEIMVTYQKINDINISSVSDIVNISKLVDTMRLVNHMELSYQIDELYNRTMCCINGNVLYSKENFQQDEPEMLSLKSADGGKMFCVDNRFFMTSFNAIHPATKSDKVDLIIRDCDYYSYIAEFIINKKKDNYQLHEFLRFRKL